MFIDRSYISSIGHDHKCVVGGVVEEVFSCEDWKCVRKEKESKEDSIGYH